MNDMTPTSAERAEKLEGHGLQAQARRGHPLRPGQGQLCRRHQAAGHAVRRFCALAARPCAHQEDRHDQGRGRARRGRRAHGGDAQAVNLPGCRRLPATCRWCWPTGRCCSRTRKSPSSSPRTAISPPTRPNWSKSNTRRCPCNVDPFKAMAPDAPVMREDIKDKTDGAHGPRKHHNHIFNWQAGDKAATDAAFAKADVTIKETDLLSARAPLPAGDLPVRRLVRQDQGRADAVGHLPGAARDPHGRLADLEDSRAQDPRHRARHRRRLRQQGRRLSGLHLRDRRLDRDRPAGEMGRGPHRESFDHRLRARLSHGDGDRRDQGRQGHRACAPIPSPTTARSTPAPIRPNGRPACSTSSPAPTTSRPRMCRWTASTPTRRRAASPIAARSASPKRPIASSAPWISWRRSSAWTRPNSA